MRVRGAALTASAAVAVSTVVTVANRLGEFRLSALASSPAAVGEGKVWLVVSSALLADRPAVVSLIGFWIVGFAALLVCSARLVAGAAVGGHILSALAIYGVIGVARLASPHAFASVMHVPDYGMSAIIAAWLGAMAGVLWRRHQELGPRLLVILGTLVCLGVGLLFRPDMTFLDSEHVLAYALGVALADEAVRKSLAHSPRRLIAATSSLISASAGLGA